jgi:uncharacterized membrane protein YhaH (DUF805 family)
MTLLFSFAGRISRTQWWIGSLVIVAYVLVVALIEIAIFGLGPSKASTAGRIEGLFLFDLVRLYASFCIAAKRFQDRGKPALCAQVTVGVWLAYSVLNLIGVAGLNLIGYGFSVIMTGIMVWFTVELGCLRGTVGPNKYGPDPV